MKKLLSIFLLSISLIGYSQEESDSRLSDNVDTTEEFELEDGQLKRESNWKGGKLDGLSKKWYINGQLESEVNYKADKLDGLSKEWYSDGQLESESNYKDGEKDGLYRTWYENGQLQLESNYKDGIEDGLSKEWYSDGQLEFEFNYKDGKEDGLWKSWYINGQLEIESNWKDGKRIGRSKFWTYDGLLYGIDTTKQVNLHNVIEIVDNEREIEGDNESPNIVVENLHASIINFKTHVFSFKTSKFLIRIDELEDDKIRYSSWGKSSSFSDKPSVVLKNGQRFYEGSRGNNYFLFKSGEYSYQIWQNMVSDKMSSFTLQVYRNDKLILEQESLE